MGKGVAAAGQREYHYRSGRKQTRLGDGTTGQAGDPDGRGTGVRERSRPTILRDFGEDGGERSGAVHGDREETSIRSSRPPTYQARTTTRCELGA